MTQVNFKINGLHCKSCKSLIETEVKATNKVANIDVDHLNGTASMEFDGNIEEVYNTIEDLGYGVVREINPEESKKKDVVEIVVAKKPNAFLIPGISLVSFILAYFLIQKFNLFSLMSQLNEVSISYSVIFAIGLLASFHCIGMCGGLVITYTASSKLNDNQETNDSKIKNLLPHIQYNLGRLISYTIIGGILGGFGSFFGINPVFAGVMTIFVAIFMIMMGLSLYSEHRFLDQIKLSTPAFIAKFIFSNKHDKKPKGPFIIGVLTGFMPCGPLQAMQLFALASGSIFNGAMAMFLYSLGTIPLMLGFGTLISSISHVKIRQLMKFSGILVVLLGLMMVNRGLVNFGYGFNPSMQKNTAEQTADTNKNTKDVQIVEMAVTYNGYSPNVLHIKKDIPVKWIIKDKGITGCTSGIKLYLPEGTINKDLVQKGDTVIEFTPTNAGELKFSCWMSMVWGKFIVE